MLEALMQPNPLPVIGFFFLFFIPLSFLLSHYKLGMCNLIAVILFDTATVPCGIESRIAEESE